MHLQDQITTALFFADGTVSMGKLWDSYFYLPYVYLTDNML